jgi:hypothetical protein
MALLLEIETNIWLAENNFAKEGMDFFTYGRNCYIWPAHMKQPF